MKTGERTNRNRALTLIEVLVIIGALFLLWTILVCPRPGHRAKASRIRCVNNLKAVSLSFRLFEIDHGGRFPMQLSTNEGGSREFGGEAFLYYRVLSNELSTPKVLLCPTDRRTAASDFTVFKNQHLSYFVGLDVQTNQTQTLLAGDRNLTNATGLRDGVLILKTNQNDLRGTGWGPEMHEHAGNVALPDGSVQQVTTSRLREQIRSAEIDTQRIAPP